MSDELYLGDGLYASFDGYQIKLRAPREENDHVIYLDASLFEALVSYGRKCWPEPGDKSEASCSTP